jgi:predicted AlkP superfamily phosphohydrolase/phosphomutase
MEKKPKVIVIGLDGATWDLIKPWADEGTLPTFKELMKGGAWGKLESTIPPATYPAWQSLFTGMNPGKLGVFDFFQLNRERRMFSVNMPESFHGKPVWDILADYGYKSVLINIPTAKVSKVDGAMVGGIFSNLNSYFYPPQIKQDLIDLSYHPYPIELTKNYLAGKQSFDENKFKELAKKTINSRFQLGERLIKKFKPDFVALVIFVIDNIQHFFWGEEIVKDSWRYIDDRLGKFIEGMEDSHIILCSDHGQTNWEKTFFIARYLNEEGYLYLHKPFGYRLLKRVTKEQLLKFTRYIPVGNFLRKFVPAENLRRVFQFFPDQEGRMMLKLERVVDWEKSKCIPKNNAIYLNCDEKEKSGLKLELKEKLCSLKLHGESVMDNVVSSDEVYSGRYVQAAPDLILKPKKGVRVLDSPFNDAIFSEGDIGRWKAIHAMHGIFLIKGPTIKPKLLTDLRIYDITPTILNLFGIPVEGLDGKPINEVIETSDLDEKHHHPERIRLKKVIKKLRMERTDVYEKKISHGKK